MTIDDNPRVQEAFRQLERSAEALRAFPLQWVAASAEGLVRIDSRVVADAEPEALLVALERSGLAAEDVVLYFVDGAFPTDRGPD